MSSKSVEVLVPRLDGANYQAWAMTMTAFLCAQGLWSITGGRDTKPSEIAVADGATPTAAQIAQIDARRKERLDWDNRDDQALGFIQLRIAHSLYHHVGGTSYRTWKNLEDAFGKPGPAMIHADFKQAVQFKLSGGNPGPEISRLHTLLTRLTANKAGLSEFHQTMLLISALPSKWDYLASQYMMDNKDITDYKFVNFRAILISEWERQHGAPKQTQQRADKLSAVKRKGKSPEYKNQKQRTNNRPADDAGDDRAPKRKRGPRKGKGKATQGDDSSHHHHSHLSSAAVIEEVEEVPEPPAKIYFSQKDVPVNARGNSIVASHRPDKILYRPLNHAGNTHPAGRMRETKTYPDVQAARDLASRMGVTKNALNLKALEKLKEHTRFVEGTSIYQNAVASSSSTRVEDQPVPLNNRNIVDRISSPTPPDYEKAEKRRRENIRRTKQRAKKTVKSPSVVRSEGDEPLDWGTDDGVSEHGVDNDIAEAAGLSHHDDDYDDRFHPDDFYEPDQYRQVPCISLTSDETNLLDKQLRILVATISSLGSDCNLNKNITCHSSGCTKCKKNQGLDFLGDSGASLSFTPERSDFSTYEEIRDGPQVQTADENTQMRIIGKGTIFITHEAEDSLGKFTTRNGALHPVYHIPGLSTRLLSIGSLLVGGLSLRGDEAKMNFYSGHEIVMTLTPHIVGQTIYWLNARHTPEQSLVASKTVHEVDYDLMHRRFGHPSKDILRRASGNTKNFPQGVTYPKVDPICRGCAEGKMPSPSFPQSVSRATKPFEMIHMDLKSMPVVSYHKYRYFIVFYDDYTSHGWTIMLRLKSDTEKAIKHFIAIAKVQFEASISSIQIDEGGEFKGMGLKDLFADLGIKILRSVPHMHQQNGRAERFIRTIMDKAQAIRFDACIPPSWWEFTVLHAVHLYNRTPIRRLEYKTPYELLKHEKPDVSYFRVFGCGAYVFLPEEVRTNKLAPKSELMTFIGYADGVKGYLFMRSTNYVFTAVKALFNENIFPRCPDGKRPNFESIRPPPGNSNHNIPPGSDADNDDGDEDDQFPLPDRNVPQQEDHNPPYPDDLLEEDERERIPREAPSSPSRSRQLPQDDSEGSQPRRSGRLRRAPQPREGDIYGDRNPVDRQRMSTRDWQNLQRGDPAPSSAQPDPTDSSQLSDRLLTRMAQEGGVSLINFLLQKAIPHEGDIPNPTKVKEWSFRDILRLPKKEQEEWKAACKEELEALRKREVFEITDLPKGRKIIRNRWVFDIKSDGRKRARLVAKGFSQVEGIDFDEIFSPVVRFETVRLMLALSSLESWHVQGVDVRNAFLYGKLDEEIYMEQPEGFKIRGQEHKVLRLRRALYGLKQAALAWWKQLAESMNELGFKRLVADAGLFVYRKDGQLVIAVIYVDDAMFFGPDQKVVLSKKRQFMDKWECRDLGETQEFLRMRIARNNNNVEVDQVTYLEKILQRFNMANAKVSKTPLPEGYNPQNYTGQVDPERRSLYQQVIGSLLYLMLGTRPDICFAVTKMSQFASNPSQEHLDKAISICRYLVGTKSYKLVFRGDSQKGLMAYVDSDWAANKDTRRSVTGYFFKLADCIFCWQSRAQKTVALSSTEAEYMALSDCSRQALWLETLLSELGIVIQTVPIYGDNQGSIFNASNPVQEKRSKHIDIRYHFIRQCVEDKKVELLFIDGSENPADLFTKNLGNIKFSKFRQTLGLEFYST